MSEPKVPSKMEVEYRSVAAADFIRWEVQHYDKQRFLSEEWVEQLVTKQEQIYRQYGELIIPGVFTFVQYERELYLIDGQHRWAMLKRLYHNGIRIRGTIGVAIYTVDDVDTIDDIYYLLTKSYTVNGTFDEDGKSYPHLDKTEQLVEKFRQTFPNHIRSRVNKVMPPFFDLNDLSEQLNKYCLWKIHTVEEVWEMFVSRNDAYRMAIKDSHPALYEKALRLDCFYLSIGQPKCSWVRKALKEEWPSRYH